MDTKTILILDDDPNLRKTLSDILKAKGYLPVPAATGKEALDRVKEKEPAVAFIDLRLEDMSGLEVMGQIKKCSPATECIVITGHASQESAIEAVNLGAYGYVRKPYDMEQLLVITQRAVEKRETEEALKDSEKRLSLALDATNSGTWDFNPHTFTNMHFNDTWFTMLGYKPDELPHTAETWIKLMYPDDSERVQNKLRDHIEKRDKYCVEFRMKTKDGSYRWIQSTGKIISWDEQGNPERMVGIHLDIDDRKTAEAERKKLEARLRQS